MDRAQQERLVDSAFYEDELPAGGGGSLNEVQPTLILRCGRRPERIS